MAVNINTQTKEVNIVIRKNKEIDKKLISKWCDINCSYYAYIEHKQDVSIYGEIEGIHYHLVCILPKRRRLITILNDLVCALDLSNANGIEIDRLSSLSGSIQYLIHKNDSNKTQHKKSEIITNYSSDELDTLLTTDSLNGCLSFNRVYEICYNAKSILDVIKAVGFGSYHYYRNTIKDIWDYVSTHRDREQLQVPENELPF